MATGQIEKGGHAEEVWKERRMEAEDTLATFVHVVPASPNEHREFDWLPQKPITRQGSIS